MESEDPEDGAYAFHRSVQALNVLLAGMELAMSDIRISTVSTKEVGAIVYCGALTPGGNDWERLGNLLMHPDRFPDFQEPVSLESLNRQLNGSLNDLYTGRPFLISVFWHNRARRAFSIRGDNADTIISLQTAVESMMYDLLRGLLVDIGKTDAHIKSRVGADTHFKSLLSKELPPLIGGDWSFSGKSTISAYWQSIYLVRNRIVHSGYSPTIRETEEAMEAYLDLREHINTLLWRRHKQYPRTLLAKIGENGLVRRGWMSEWMKQQCMTFLAEPQPFYWPRDVAGR
jgi:hypothetical protein